MKRKAPSSNKLLSPQQLQSDELMRQMKRKTARLVSTKTAASSLALSLQDQKHQQQITNGGGGASATTLPRSMSHILRQLKAEQSPSLLYQCPYSHLVDVLEGGRGEVSPLQRYQSINCRTDRPLWLVQEEAVQFIKACEGEDGGGSGTLYCDEMGLGKTRSVLVAVMEQNQARSRLTGRRFNGPTLIICAPILVANWVKELEAFPRTALVYQVLGEPREAARSSVFMLVECCDIVVTTYSALRAMRHNPERHADAFQLLYNDIVWHRIVADEAHVFVDESTETAQDVFALRGRCKIAMTGTPVRNRRLDLKTLFRFVSTSNSTHDIVTPAYTKEAVDRIMLMRTREQALERQRQVRLAHPLRLIHCLPELKAVTRRIQLVQFASMQEKVIYYMYAKIVLQRKLSDRYNTPMLIGVMRQLCISAAVVKNLVLPLGLLRGECSDDNAALPHNLFAPGEHHDIGGKQVDDGGDDDDTPIVRFMRSQPLACRIQYRSGEAYRKLDPLYHNHQCQRQHDTDEAGSDSGHSDDDNDIDVPASTCAACAGDSVDFVWDPFALCPASSSFSLAEDQVEARQQYAALYREMVAPGHHIDIEKQQTSLTLPEVASMRHHLSSRLTWLQSRPSSKEQAIVDYVRGTPADDRIIIFSLYTGILDGLERALQQHGIGCVVVTGRTNARTNAMRLKLFQQGRTQYKVLLMTLKLGNMGLNLTDCNHVLHADPWWNPWATEQGDYRIRRPGQLKPIFIIYFVMDHTMEVAIMNHTIRKKTMLKSMADIVDDDALSAEDQTLLFDYEVDITPLSVS